MYTVYLIIWMKFLLILPSLISVDVLYKWKGGGAQETLN